MPGNGKGAQRLQGQQDTMLCMIPRLLLEYVIAQGDKTGT